MNAFKNDIYVPIFLDFIVGVTRRIALYNKNIKLIRVDSNDHLRASSLDLLSEGLYADIIQDIKDIKLFIFKNNISVVNDDSISDFIYACACHVDELIIKKLDKTMTVPFRGMAERVLFGSVIAGENIFNKVEILISKKSHADLAMASIYYLMISFGFKGKYLAKDDHCDLLILANNLKSISFDEPHRKLPSLEPVLVSNSGQLFSYRKYILLNGILLFLLFLSILVVIAFVDYNWNYYYERLFDQV